MTNIIAQTEGTQYVAGGQDEESTPSSVEEPSPVKCDGRYRETTERLAIVELHLRGTKSHWVLQKV